MTKHKKGIPDPLAVRLAAWVVAFVNVTWGRKLRAAKSLVDTIQDVLESGYSEDDVRSAFWVTATLPGSDWLKEALRPGDRPIQPEIVLRYHGGVNPVTGKEAVRWLDDRLARVEETSGRLVAGVLERLKKELGPGEPYEAETAFLRRAGFPDGEE